DADNAKGLAQQWKCSCAPTTAEVVRGEMDPIYALTVNRKNADLTAVDPRTGWVDTINAHNGKKVGNHDIADEQRNELEANGGNAVERDEKGGDGIDTLKALNDETRWTGVTYEDHPVVSADRRPKLGGVEQQMYDFAANQQLKSAFQKVD